MLMNTQFSLTYFGPWSSLRLLWTLPALFSLPSCVREGPKLSHCHFWLAETYFHSSSRRPCRESPPLLLPSRSRISQNHPLFWLEQMIKIELMETFSEKCAFAGTHCLAKGFHGDTINSLFFFVRAAFCYQFLFENKREAETRRGKENNINPSSFQFNGRYFTKTLESMWVLF